MAIIITALGLFGALITILGLYAIILGHWPFQD